MNNVCDIIFYNLKNKEKIAIDDNGVKHTYGQLISDIDKYINLLKKYKLKRNDRVAIYLPNCYEYIVILFACFRAGCIVVPINWINSKYNVNFVIADAQCKVIFMPYEKKEKLYEHIINEEVRVSDNIYLFALDFIDDKKVDIDTKLALLIYTSGSTGNPKGVMITHENILAGTRIVVDYLYMSTNDRVLSILPFSFDYGINQVLTTLYVKGTIIIKYPYLFHEIPQILYEKKITGLACVGSMWVSILNLKNLRKYEYLDLRYITNSGESIPEFYLTKLSEVFRHTSIYLMYGLTECFRCTYLCASMFEQKKGSIGKAIPESEVYIINNDMKLCAAGEVGELLFRGPTVAKGYWNNIENDVFRKNILNTFYDEIIIYSGDLVYKDEDGYIYFVGRKDNMVKRNGYRISTMSIETELMQNFKIIKECCILGIELNNSNIILVAFIEVDDIYVTDKMKQEILEYSNHNFPTYMRLEDVLLIKILHNNNGKQDIVRLKSYYENYVANKKK